MKLVRSLYFQVIVAIVIGVIVGAIWPDFGASLKPLGEAFVNLVKMIIAPVVFCTVTAGIAHMGDMKRFGRVGLKALFYFEVVSTFALILGLVVGMVVGPGRGFSKPVPTTVDPIITGYVQKASGQTVSSYLLHLIPDSFFSPFASGELLQVVLIAILTGFALTGMGDLGKSLAEGLDKIGKVFFKIIQLVVRLAPIGAFGAMAFTVGKYHIDVLLNLGGLVATFYLTSILFVIVVLGVVARLAGFSIFKFLSYIKDELLIVLGASSSESVLPQLMEKMENAGVSKSVVGVVVPTGYSFNLDGTNIYMTLATLFLAQATNTPLSFSQLLTLLLVSMLTSKGATGVTGAGFITLAATLAAVPTIPVGSLVFLMGVDRFMSECRALTNTVGNGIACIVVAKWDGELDQGRLAAVLSGKPVLDEVVS